MQDKDSTRVVNDKKIEDEEKRGGGCIGKVTVVDPFKALGYTIMNENICICSGDAWVTPCLLC